MNESVHPSVCFVTGDLHIGDGGNLDDFEDDERFASWLASMDAPATRLVLNGDVVDYAQIPPYDVDPGTPSHLLWREPRSVEKLATAIERHPVFFDALADFHRRGGWSTVIVGNHDLDFAWPAVQSMWRERTGGSIDRTTFETYAMRFGNVWIQHGHQHTKENLTRDLHDFIHVGPDGEEYLERVWGTDFVISFFNDIHDELPFAQNIKPTWQLVVQGLRHRWLGWRHFVRTVAFVARAGIPLGLIPEVLLDADADREPDLSRLDDHFADVATARLVRDMIAELDPAELLATDLDESLRAALASGTKIDLVAEELDRRADGEVTLGLFRDDRIVRGARSHLGDGIDHVVFGHTHHIVDGQELAPGKKLFNPGTWIPFFHLDDEQVEAAWRASGFTKQYLTDSSFYVRDIRAVEIRSDGSEPRLVRLP